MGEHGEITGERVLQVLDAHSGLTWLDLIRALGVTDDTSTFHGKMNIANCLSDLFSVGLLYIAGIDGPLGYRMDDGNHVLEMFDGRRWADPENNSAGKLFNRTIHTSKHWHTIQMALKGQRHSGFMRHQEPKFSMIAYPSFGPPHRLEDISDIFAVMPFNQEMDKIYQDHIVKVASGMNLSINRADNISSTKSIMQDIWSMIVEARVVISEITQRNANVFYEMGIAHTVGVPVIILTQALHEVPFDLRHMRILEYRGTDISASSFEEKLKDFIESAVSEDRGGWLSGHRLNSL